MLKQVFQTGRMVVFTKSQIEACTKTILFKNVKIGLQSDAQIAMLSNLVSFFDK